MVRRMASSSIESRVAASAARFAEALVAELRRAPVADLLALASEPISPRIDLGNGARGTVRKSPARRPELAKQRIEHAVDEIVAENRLNDRERFMLLHVPYGALRDELAEAMGLAHQTTKMHIRGLLRKLGAKGLGEVASRILHRAASYE